MRRLLTAFTVTLLLSYSAGAQNKSDREKASLLGPVRTVRTQNTDYSDGTLQERLGTKERDTVTYDQKGNEIERVIYDDYGFLRGKEVRTYDAQGNLTENVFSDETGVVGRRVYTYQNGKRIRIVASDSKGKVDTTQDNLYGKDGLILEEKYSAGGKALGKTVYKHDQNGNLTGVRFYLANGAKAIAPVGPCLGAHRMTYSYNKQNQPTKVVAYEPNGEFKASWKYSYDTKGQTTEKIYETQWSKQAFTFAYEYDSRGNWTRQIVTKDYVSSLAMDMENTRATSVVSRDISYYE